MDEGSHPSSLDKSPPQITVRRDKTYADRLRAYKVTIDGAAVASIRAGQSTSFSVAPGARSIGLQIDWCGCHPVSFVAQPGEHITFDCGSGLSGKTVFLALFFVIFGRKSYLWLRRAT